MIPCNTEAPNRLLTAVMSMQWRQRCEGWREELAALIRQLEDVLSADFSRSAEAANPEHLRASAATEVAEEMDFEAMSHILGQSRLEHPLPELRRKRINAALKTLKRVAPLFDGKSTYGDGDEPVLHVDSHGLMAIAVPGGRADEELNLSPGLSVGFRRPRAAG